MGGTHYGEGFSITAQFHEGGGGVLLAGCVTEPAEQETVSEAAPMAAMTAEEILTRLGMMPGSPGHA